MPHQGHEPAVAVGESTLLCVEMLDAEDRVLVGGRPLTWSIVGDQEVASLRSAIDRNQSPVTSDTVQVDALAADALTAGERTIRAEDQGGAFVEIELRFE